MKNNSLYVLLLLSINTVVCPLSEVLPNKEQHSISSPAKESCTSLSETIAASFLQARKKAIKESNLDFVNKYNTEQQLFKIGWNSQLQDVKMHIKREGSQESPVVIIDTSVQGAPEDFEGQNILGAEQHLLKNIIINSYLSKFKESPSKNPITVVLDNNSKVTFPPTYMISVRKQQFFSETQEICNDRKSMQVVTIFTQQEFDNLVKKYFDQNDPEAPAPLSSNMFFEGAVAGAASTAFLVWACRTLL